MALQSDTPSAGSPRFISLGSITKEEWNKLPEDEKKAIRENIPDEVILEELLERELVELFEDQDVTRYLSDEDMRKIANEIEEGGLEERVEASRVNSIEKDLEELWSRQIGLENTVKVTISKFTADLVIPLAFSIALGTLILSGVMALAGSIVAIPAALVSLLFWIAVGLHKHE